MFRFRATKYLSLSACIASTAVIALLPSAAEAKSVGGCPRGGNWDLVTVESLGITPETASGLSSLDGNGDGLTCLRPIRGNGPFAIFRDNTVRA